MKLVHLYLLTVEEATIDPLGELGERVSKFLPGGTEQTLEGSPATIKDYPLLDLFEDQPTITEFVRQLTRRMSEFRATLKDSAESPTGRLC